MRKHPLMPMHGRSLCLLFDPEVESATAPRHEDFQLEVSDVVRFRVASPGFVVYRALATGPRRETEAKIEFWFLHVFLPLYLAAVGGQLIFHGAAVTKAGRGHVLLGRSGVGKSTLVEGLLARGFDLCSDDKVHVVHRDGQWLMPPSHRCLRPYRAFEDLGRNVGSSLREPVRIVDLTVLEPRGRGSTDELRILQGSEAVQCLVEHRLYDFRALRARNLEPIVELARFARVARLERPDGLAFLSTTCRQLEARWASEDACARA